MRLDLLCCCVKERALLDAPTALAACCGFDLCHKYILYLYLYLYLRQGVRNGLSVRLCVLNWVFKSDYFAQLLCDQLALVPRGVASAGLAAPFDSLPPSEPLPTLPSHVILSARASACRGGGWTRVYGQVMGTGEGGGAVSYVCQHVRHVWSNGAAG